MQPPMAANAKHKPTSVGFLMPKGKLYGYK